jgi:hypothetical protein
MLRLLVVMAISVLSIISSQILGLHWLNSYLMFSEEYFPLWASFGVIISALMATTSSTLTIENANLQRINELNKQKVSELKYILHILVKIQQTFSIVLKSIENNTFDNYPDSGLKEMRKDIISLSNKLDSKELFYFLSKDNSGKIMNIIARLHSIAYVIETSQNDRIMMEKIIKSNLVNHESGYSLLPFLKDVIQSIGQELELK